MKRLRGCPLVALALVLACSDTVSPPLLSILGGDTLTLRIGHTRRLDAVVSIGGSAPTSRTASYRSSDSSRATVTATGLVVAVSAGQVSITARWEGVSDSILVIVPDREPTRLVFSRDSLPVSVGGNRSFPSVTVYDVDSSIIPPAELTFAFTSNPAIATVSPAGTITGVKPGRTWVRVSVGGLSDSLRVISHTPFDRTAQFVATGSFSGTEPFPLDVADNGAVLYAKTSAGLVYRFFLDAPSAGVPIDVDSLPVSIAVTRDGSRAYVANYGSLNISVIDVPAGTVIGTLTVPQTPGAGPNRPQRLGISEDGSRLFVATSSGLFHVMQSSSGTVDTTYFMGADPMDVEVVSGRVAMVNRSGLAGVINATTGLVERSASVTTSGSTYGITIGADTATLVGATENGIRIVPPTGPVITLLPTLWGHDALVAGALLAAGAFLEGNLYSSFGLHVYDTATQYLVRSYTQAGSTGTMRLHRPSGTILIHSWGGIQILR